MRFITLSVFATLLSAPAFAADLGTYRPGTPYSSVVAGGADVCDNQCAGDAQCRGWNYVKPNPIAAGVCEFLSSVSTPISSQISISGESQSSSPYYSRLTTGSTNTVRVGTQTATPPRASTVRVGQARAQAQNQTLAGRQIVRQAPSQQFKTQQASIRSIQDMSLTAQQNRYRQGQAGVPQQAVQPQIQRPVQGQRPAFRPILDESSPQYRGQQTRQPQINQPQINQAPERQASRRITGPRRTQGQATQQFQGPRIQGKGQATPQFQDPRFQDTRAQRPQPLIQQRGQSRPPVGQPIAAAQPPARPQALTPSQRLAQFTASTRTQTATTSQAGPVALNPEQARTSLFGRLNDDVNIPTASAVPTQPVAEQALGDVLAGGL